MWEIITHQKKEQDKIQPHNFAELKLADHALWCSNHNAEVFNKTFWT